MGYLGSPDTFYVGTLKGVGRIYQQTFIDTYSAVGFAKLYMTKHPIVALFATPACAYARRASHSPWGGLAR